MIDQNLTADELLAREQIRQVLHHYALACDQRDWALFEQVFTAEVAFSYGAEDAGGYRARGRDKLLKMIRNSLEGCGPTQHLLGNFSITVSGDTGSCHCYVRAFHRGRGAKQDQLYEALGEYRDTLLRQDGQWKISERKFVFTSEVGSREVLGPH